MEKDHSLEAYTDLAAHLRLLYTLCMHTVPVLSHTMDAKRSRTLSRAIKYIDDLRYELDYELWHRHKVDGPSWYTWSGFNDTPQDEVDRKVTERARYIARQILRMDPNELDLSKYDIIDDGSGDIPDEPEELPF